MSSPSTRASESSALLPAKRPDSDAISYQSFPGPNDVDTPNEDAPLLSEMPGPSSAAKHGITVLRGTLIVASLGVLVFLQGEKQLLLISLYSTFSSVLFLVYIMKVLSFFNTIHRLLE